MPDRYMYHSLRSFRTYDSSHGLAPTALAHDVDHINHTGNALKEGFII